MTRLLRRSFNDGYYAVPVREWEQDRVPRNFWFAVLDWGWLVGAAAYGIGSTLQVNSRG